MKTLVNNRGTITVFLAIVFVAVLLVAGVLIDVARIILAQRLVKGALDSAVRSAFAGCHEGLVGEFGLFGSEIKESDINRYFQVNLTTQGGSLKLLKFYDLSLKIKTAPSDSLLNDENMETQIRQYMQYKAPLLIGENLIRRLNNCGLSEKATLMQSGQQLISLRKKLREECSSINQALADLKRITGQITGLTQNGAAEISGEVIDSIKSLLYRLDNHLLPALSAYEEAMGEFHGQEGLAHTIGGNDVGAVAGWTSVWRKEMQNTLWDLQNIRQLPLEQRQAAAEPELVRFRSLLSEIREINLAEYPAQPDIKRVEQGHKKVLDFIKQKLALKELSENDLINHSDFLYANKPPQEPDKSAFLPGVEGEGYCNLSEETLEKEADQVIAFLSAFKKKLGELVEQGQDHLYRVEYILDKFTFLTSSTRRDHFLEKGETEYILGGSKFELHNLVFIFQQIWTCRFAVNTLSSFVKSPLPELMSRMAEALAQGFTGACSDTVRIYNGEAVAFFPDLPNLRLGYSDYLRIFLLLQDKEEQLNRVRQLIQVNMRKMQKDSEFNLGYLQTKVQVTAKADINLWFLPAQAFAKTGFDLFQGGKYRIVQDAIITY